MAIFKKTSRKPTISTKQILKIQNKQNNRKKKKKK